jgi:hypothetical protein
LKLVPNLVLKCLKLFNLNSKTLIQIQKSNSLAQFPPLSFYHENHFSGLRSPASPAYLLFFFFLTSARQHQIELSLWAHHTKPSKPVRRADTETVSTS